MEQRMFDIGVAYNGTTEKVLQFIMPEKSISKKVIFIKEECTFCNTARMFNWLKKLYNSIILFGLINCFINPFRATI